MHEGQFETIEKVVKKVHEGRFSVQAKVIDLIAGSSYPGCLLKSSPIIVYRQLSQNGFNCAD